MPILTFYIQPIGNLSEIGETLLGETHNWAGDPTSAEETSARFHPLSYQKLCFCSCH
jgi:hypothetical protein